MVEIFENREAWSEQFREGWLKHFEDSGETNFKLYERVRNREQPQGSGIDLSRGRLLLITSAGGYLPASQTAFDAENDLGDYTLRLIPSDTPLDAIAYAHTHYDHTAVDADAQVLVPLRHLEALTAEGVIGTLTAHTVSFMGYQPDAARVVDELIPAILEAVENEQPDGALLVPS